MDEPSECYGPNLKAQPDQGEAAFSGLVQKNWQPEFVVAWTNCLRTAGAWEEVLEFQTALTVWLVAKHCGLHVVEGAFEAACFVVGVQKTGYEPINFDAQQKMGLLAFWASTQTVTCSLQEGVSRQEFEL